MGFVDEKGPGLGRPHGAQEIERVGKTRPGQLHRPIIRHLTKGHYHSLVPRRADKGLPAEIIFAQPGRSDERDRGARIFQHVVGEIRRLQQGFEVRGPAGVEMRAFPVNRDRPR